MKMRASVIPLLMSLWLSYFGSGGATIPQDGPAPQDTDGSGYSDFIHPQGDPATTVAASSELLKPVALTQYPADHPSSAIPVLKWTVPSGAVYFEVELLNDLPENPGDVLPSRYRNFATEQVFTNGYMIDLSSFNTTTDHLYWRVRGLSLAGDPVGVFSDAAPLCIDYSLGYELKPVPYTGYTAAGMPMPLYPVYAWIPIPGAVSYLVEVTNAPPENPGGIAPSIFQIRSMPSTTITDCYDESPLSEPGTYWWRVRGLDEEGDPIGVFSAAEEFTVPYPGTGFNVATLGDSITHGGGGISYSPACVEFDYQRYLSFPVLNLGRSGDTSATMRDRFETDVLPFRPQYLIIMGGTNSLRGGVPAQQVITELAGIRDKCRRYGIKPIFLTLPPVNPDSIQRAFQEDTAPGWQGQFAQVNQFIRRQPDYIDIAVPEFYDADGNLPPKYAVDGMHMDAQGKRLMADIINEAWSRIVAP